MALVTFLGCFWMIFASGLFFTILLPEEWWNWIKKTTHLFLLQGLLLLKAWNIDPLAFKKWCFFQPLCRGPRGTCIGNPIPLSTIPSTSLCHKMFYSYELHQAGNAEIQSFKLFIFLNFHIATSKIHEIKKQQMNGCFMFHPQTNSSFQVGERKWNSFSPT